MGMNALPSDISLNIFSRLDVDSVLECKLVCKPWRNLIKDPSFARMHLARHKLILQYHEDSYIQDFSNNACDTVQSGFLSLKQIGRSNRRTLHYVENDVDVKEKSYKIKNKMINIPPIKDRAQFDSEHFMISSCNGLICSSMRHHQLNDPIHIFNPVTREYAYLPRYTCEEENGAYEMMSGFGYSPSTDQYKVVRIYHKRNDKWYFQVYVLGNENNKWKEEKEIPNSLFHNVGGKGVFVNGEIYWLDQASKVATFDIADEEFHHIASPPLVEEVGSTIEKRLCVFGDWLCLVHRISALGGFDPRFDIWLLKKKNNDINVQQNGTRNWNKEFTVYSICRNPGKFFFPLVFTKKGKCAGLFALASIPFSVAALNCAFFVYFFLPYSIKLYPF
ncbi:F-box protein At3g07870-like [Papaver somniferum]|uniref:F-box protein At3g07870-like n=1 Tax=Papaver somniferum TaxID=3469 RepID=UPI000E6FB1D9|nr:F-box protein At3g07870-like [Papaver somniferum]